MASQFSGSNLAGAIALATAAAVLPQPAFGQSADQLRAQAETQYAALSAEAEIRAGDPAFDYRLGVTAADSGHYGEAIIAFQRVLAVQPTLAQARAELARAYALAGDIDTARAQFATVVDDPSLPDPVRQRFTGFAEAGAGHAERCGAGDGG
jgi:Flp pilus assembly protein TadD